MRAVRRGCAGQYSGRGSRSRSTYTIGTIHRRKMESDKPTPGKATGEVKQRRGQRASTRVFTCNEICETVVKSPRRVVPVASVSAWSLEFCCELRLKVTARVFKHSPSLCHRLQYFVQPLWAQYHTVSPRKSKTYFDTKAHNLLLSYGFCAVDARCCADLLVILRSRRGLEVPDALPFPLPSSGSFLCPKTSKSIPTRTALAAPSASPSREGNSSQCVIRKARKRRVPPVLSAGSSWFQRVSAVPVS